MPCQLLGVLLAFPAAHVSEQSGGLSPSGSARGARGRSWQLVHHPVCCAPSSQQLQHPTTLH